MAAKTSWHRYGTKLRHCHGNMPSFVDNWVDRRYWQHMTSSLDTFTYRNQSRPNGNNTCSFDTASFIVITQKQQLSIKWEWLTSTLAQAADPLQLYNQIDWVVHGFMSHSTQHRSLRRRFSKPVVGLVSGVARNENWGGGLPSLSPLFNGGITPEIFFWN